MAAQPEIDLGEHGVSPPVVSSSKWKPPRHVYFGPRDPETGDMAEEPVYVHQEYPRLMYWFDAEDNKIRAVMVHNDGERDAFPHKLEKNPGAFGYIGAPTLEDHIRLTEEAKKDAILVDEEKTLAKADAILRKSDKKGK